jgi:dTDP-4-dehydrorhamnose reductase
MTNRDQRTILLTGVNGQVGFELARSLQGLGNVVAVDRRTLDLGDLDQIRRVVREIGPSLIVNPAAYTAVDKAESDVEAAMRVNGEGPGVLAEEAKRLGAAFVHYSTDYVFDGTKEGAYVEDDAVNPQNVYGRSKLAGEEAVRASGAAHLILRTSWVYGHRSKSFFTTMLALAQKGAALRIVGDQFGAPTWSKMLAQATAHIVAQSVADSAGDDGWWRERSGIYHLTGADSTSWAGFARAIFDTLPSQKQVLVNAIPASEYPTPARRPANSRLSNEKIASVFGLRTPSWTDSLRLCVAEARESASYAALFQS